MLNYSVAELRFFKKLLQNIIELQFILYILRYVILKFIDYEENFTLIGSNVAARRRCFGTDSKVSYSLY